jgi:hypothetical protein
MNAMKRVWTTLLLATFLTGCATKIYRKVPPPQDPANAAEIFIIRTRSIVGAGLGIGVQIDGYKIASLSVGHHLRIQLDSGQHAVGTMSGSITLDFAPNSTYYFLVGIGVGNEQTIERLDASDASKWLAGSKEVRME